MSGEVRLLCGHVLAEGQADATGWCQHDGSRLRDVVLREGQVGSDGIRGEREKAKAWRTRHRGQQRQYELRRKAWAGGDHTLFALSLLNVGVDPRPLALEVSSSGAELGQRGKLQLPAESELQLRAEVPIAGLAAGGQARGQVVVHWPRRHSPDHVDLDGLTIDLIVDVVEPEWQLVPEGEQPYAEGFDLRIVNNAEAATRLTLVLPEDLDPADPAHPVSIVVPARGHERVALQFSEAGKSDSRERVVAIRAKDPSARLQTVQVTIEPRADSLFRQPIGIDFGMAYSAVAVVAAGHEVQTMPLGNDLKNIARHYAPTKLARRSGTDQAEELWGWDVLRMIARQGVWTQQNLSGWEIWEDFKRELASGEADDQRLERIVDVGGSYLRYLLKQVVGLETQEQVEGSNEQVQFTNVVVTYPAEWSQRARALTARIMERAGIARCVTGGARRLPLPEPVAALLSFLHHFPNLVGSPDQWTSVFDWGAGTLDLTALSQRAIQREDGGEDVNVNQEALSGRAFLGGRDLDRTIVERVLWPALLRAPVTDPAVEDLRRFTVEQLERAPLDSDEHAVFSTLMYEAEYNLKIEVSEGRDVTRHVVRVNCGEYHFEFTCDDFSARELAQLAEGFVVKALEAVRDHCQTLRNKRLDVKVIALTGGTSLLPGLDDRVKAVAEGFFPGVVVRRHPHSIVAVAEGAALFAATIPRAYTGLGEEMLPNAIGYLVETFAGGPVQVRPLFEARRTIKPGEEQHILLRRRGGGVLQVDVVELREDDVALGMPRPGRPYSALGTYRVELTAADCDLTLTVTAGEDGIIHISGKERSTARGWREVKVTSEGGAIAQVFVDSNEKAAAS
ncbi:MAG: hypothetical protein KKI08_22515 [Armatimonadetes bacterium]|nr:hypothetical protein [Armatimonadota bacterium]